MRNRLLLSLLLVATPGCGSAAETPADSLAGPVTYEVKSWGRLLLHWHVNPDGSGEIWRGPRQMKDAPEIRKYRMRLAGDPFRTFVRNVEDVRIATKDGIPCDKEIFDLPYGSVTWDYPGRKQLYAFDAGCQSENGDEALEILGAASTIVETSANVEAKPYMTERVPPR